MKAIKFLFTALLIVASGCESKEEKAAREAKEALEKLGAAMSEAVEKSFPGAKVAAEKAEAKAEWMKKYNASADDIDDLEDTYNHRRSADDETEFWEILIDKSPEEFKKLYPPLTDREWFKAEFMSSDNWRDFERPISFDRSDRPYRLTLGFWIYTLPNKPIKTVRGNLTILDSKGVVLFDQMIEETPDVSFVDKTMYVIIIDKYDDSNSKHRDLRFADKEDLGLVFVPYSVVFADGATQSFEK